MPHRHNSILEDDPRDKGLLGRYWGYSCIHVLLPNSGGYIWTAQIKQKVTWLISTTW